MMATAPTLDTQMGEILEMLPGARRALFARYHLGGCQSCAFSHEETLRGLCERAQLDAEDVLAYLLQSHAHDSEMLVEPAAVRDQISTWRLIDIRTREEHDAVAIAGSEFLTQDLQQQIFSGDPGARLLVYDHNGRSVLDQVAWFRGHGLKQTFGLRGGIDAWSHEVDPALPRYRIEIDA